LRTKLPIKLADQITEIVTDAVLTIKKDTGIDLHMVEIMHQKEKMSTDSRLVKGFRSWWKTSKYAKKIRKLLHFKL
jgi:T-complex protein 1 subunit zeta